MNGEKRRENIIDLLMRSESPLSGLYLAKLFNVSRQVIVQDIALLRAKNHDILPTNCGYLLKKEHKPQKLLCVAHNDESILDELFTIVDLGGRVVDVRIEHQTYGHFVAELNIKSRKDAEELVKSFLSGKGSPLKNLTNDKHWHLVQADSEDDLYLIENELRKKGYLCENI